MRSFGDADLTRTAIYDNALSAAQGLQPMANARHTLSLHDVNYQGPDTYSLRDQKQAILEGRTLSRKLRGTWRLTDNATGGVLEEKKTTLAAIPYMTPRGTFVDNGNEMTLSNQMRLRSGVYTRVKDNGEIEAHVNIMPGEGVAHRYYLDPEKGVFYARVKQAKIPLLPLLRAMGADDRRLRDAWGSELLSANMQNDDPQMLNKYMERLLRKPELELDDVEKKKILLSRFQEMRTDPDVMQRTLGRPYKNMGLDAILDTTSKLLKIAKGEAEVDDRDHLAYQTVHGPEDTIAERLAKDYGGARRQLFNRASWAGNLKNIGPGALSGQVRTALLNSGLGQALEEINPSDVFDKQSRISRLGEGGIPSLDAVPDEARAVQPSHLAYIDPIRTPESFKVGIDVHLARGAQKGDDGRIYAPFQDPRTGKTVHRAPQDVADLAVAFPGQMRSDANRVWAMQSGKIRSVKKADVDLVVPHFEDSFSPLGNMIPFKSSTKGQRVAMGSRMLTQALPLVGAEAPLVQSGIPGSKDDSYESKYGKHMGAIRADKAGRVMDITEDGMTVRYADGTTETKDLYHNFPYNRKTFLHQTPMVAPGDTFQPGQTLVRSNYTNDKGVTALGLNLRTAYVPYQGKNYEDAVVISESAAKRLTSEHMYQNRLGKTDDHKLGRGAYKSLFPKKYDRRQMETIDTNGVVKVGTEVRHGDPLVLAATKQAAARNKVHKRGSQSFADASITWDHHEPGLVTDVLDGKKGITVLVKSQSSMQIGDKLSGRYGDKGVIADIIPDDRMPHGKDGMPFEILLNPNGIISRINPAQYVENALGKLAALSGKPFRVPDFEDISDLREFAERELAKAGISDTGEVYDPESGRKLMDRHDNLPFTGSRFFVKLHHSAESKGQGRGIGGYTMEDTPAKGGSEGSKRVSMMDANALLSHGATQVLRDASQVRGQRNEDYWLSFMQGHTPPEPQVPMMFKKFVAGMQSAGINVVGDGTGHHIMAMTNADVREMAGNRRITSGQTVNFEKGLEPVAGGLFDPKLTGGHNGDRWSYIKLPEPMPNPVMEEPIRRVLGLTQRKFEDVLAGREEITAGDFKGTGPKAVAHALQNINLSREISRSREAIKNGKKTARDAAVRKFGYLKSAERMGLHPGDWMLDRVPVLPPKFRPISVMSDSKLPLVVDANFLYKELQDSVVNLEDLSKEVDDVGEERLAVYKSFKAVTGLGDPLHPKLREKNVKGVLKHIFGSSPKYGTMQRRLLSSNVDMVGRAVITPNPDMDMDSVGIPENRAWEVYKNFTVRRLKRRGMPLTEAAKHVEDRSPLAREEMLNEMKARPVFINRAPVLHKFGIMAFWPKLAKTETVQFSPLIVQGFNADFDGDAVQYHVPVGEDAKREAIERMLPSKNLISTADFKSPVHMPRQEYVGGLFEATQPAGKKRRPRYFATKRDAIHAFQRGEITADTPIVYDQ